MHDINNLVLDPLHAQEQPHDRAQAPQGAAKDESGQIYQEAPERPTEGRREARKGD